MDEGDDVCRCGVSSRDLHKPKETKNKIVVSNQLVDSSSAPYGMVGCECSFSS